MMPRRTGADGLTMLMGRVKHFGVVRATLPCFPCFAIPRREKNPTTMKTCFHSALALAALAALSTPAAEPTSAPARSEWRALFNGQDLSNWDKFLARSTGSEPLVANEDPKGVFTVTSLEGENVIHVSGERYGGLTTQEEFT